jgi:phosphatidylglycerophosphate synthase
MSDTWAHVEADGSGVPLTSIVGGTSLALRHARMASRQGWRGVRFVVADEAERADLAKRLKCTPTPDSLEIDILSADEAPKGPSVKLEASALYLKETLAAPNPSPDFRITSKSELGEAQRFLFAQIRKSVALDGMISYYVMRPLGRIFTRVLLNTPVSPNQATLGALACGIGAAICAGLGGAYYALLAGILYWFGGVIDCIDGELARMRLQSSKIGEWLDSMVDEFATISLIAGIGIGLTREGSGEHWMILGLVGAAVAFLTLAPIYRELHKRKLAIDTAQFPWFFNDKGEDADAPPTMLARIINFAGHFIRRDANLTATALLLILNLRALALCVMLGAFAAAFLLMLTHFAVMRSRKTSAT